MQGSKLGPNDPQYFADVQAEEDAFHMEQFKNFVDFLCTNNYRILKFVMVLSAVGIAAGFACDPVSMFVRNSVSGGLVACVHERLVKQDVARFVIHGFLTVGPVCAAIKMAYDASQPDCGGTCDPFVWIPFLQILMVAPVITASLIRLPFWRFLFWSRIIIILVATGCWYTIMPSDGAVPAMYMWRESVFIGALVLFGAWEREKMGIVAFRLALFRIQHTESTAILGTVSHDLRTPIHVVRSIIDHLQSGEHNAESLGDPEVQKLLAQADHGCKRMQGLVEDLLLASTIHNTDVSELIMRRYNTLYTIHCTPYNVLIL
jgi:hypothetical protein